MLVASVASAQAWATEYRSSFGFTFELSSDWLVLTRDEVAEMYRDETQASLGMIDVDQATARAVLERVKRGEVEFYFDRKYSKPDLRNNISVQLTQGGGRYTTSEMDEICRLIPEELPRVFGGEVEIVSCGLQELHGIGFLAYEYFLPAKKVHVVQFEIPYVSDTRVLLIGGAHTAALAYLKSAQAAIAKRIARFASENSGPDAAPAGRSNHQGQRRKPAKTSSSQSNAARTRDR
ncbi:MAG TPA: hypothetical protein VGD18_03910 [Thiobacillaceae bacterium]